MVENQAPIIEQKFHLCQLIFMGRLKHFQPLGTLEYVRQLDRKILYRYGFGENRMELPGRPY
jgi:hypothetical protein